MNLEDTQFMKRAIEIARRGAGLVSPNPMVGAVLVKDGEVVGWGYHRWDRLKHAESYAIEMAGDRAQGATLYCSLEPCCHFGRTAPCTDSVIAAGITRVVIAVKDPNPLVNGRGVDLLRSAGIEVEAGLCEEEAVRLNEWYFKFITGKGPFVHGIIEYPALDVGTNWHPSSSFVSAASEYDALILGSRIELNRALIAAGLNRERHRAMVLVGRADDRDSYCDLLTGENQGRISFIQLSGETVLRVVDSAGQVPDSATEGNDHQIDFDKTLGRLDEAGLISVLVAPGVFDPSLPGNFEMLDKLTLAVPASASGDGMEVTGDRLAFADMEFDLEQVVSWEAEGYTEFTGYPQLRGVA
jgi:pyrimidine deaminase RibD-like protein